jgi:hypothetical protein
MNFPRAAVPPPPPVGAPSGAAPSSDAVAASVPLSDGPGGRAVSPGELSASPGERLASFDTYAPLEFGRGLHRGLRRGRVEIFPLWSRVNNIGCARATRAALRCNTTLAMPGDLPAVVFGKQPRVRNAATRCSLAPQGSVTVLIGRMGCYHDIVTVIM